jgi:PPP family 3-phenylpropionic acid transporter
MGVLAQPFWGQVADRSGLRGRVLALLAIGTGLGYAALRHATGFGGFLIATAGLALFSTALIPSCVSVSLASLSDRSGTAFGRVRVMGTLGFGVSVGCFPWLLHSAESFGIAPTSSGSGIASEPGLGLMFGLAAGALGLAALCSLLLPSKGIVSLRANRGEWRQLLHSGPFVRVLLFTFLAYLSIQGPMVLFPILVRAQGGGLDAISQMWLIMLALEVPLVFYLGAGVRRVGPRGVIAIGIVAAALRWSVSGFADDLRWVYLAQALHGVTVFGVVLGAPVYVDAVVPARLRSTGQGLLAMVGISLGSIVSNLSAGWLTELVGPRAPARVAGVLAALLALALPWLLPAVRPASD